MSDEPKPRRAGGRPRADEPGSTISAWLRESEHDRLIKIAKRNEQSVSSLVRQLLNLRIPR